MLPTLTKLKVVCLATAIASSAHAQTKDDSANSGDDTEVLLELPPKLTTNEDGEPAASEEADTLDLDSENIDLDNEAEEEVKSAPEIHVQVEKIIGRTGSIRNDGSVTIEAPWPAKPISYAPAGWKFIPAPEGSEPFRTEAKLTSGKVIELAITPHILVPESDGRTSIKISEPGYKAGKTGPQKDTLGVMLENSTAEIEKHEKHAADAIQLLQELLTSLPRQQ